ncbi:MAG: IS1 family transposase [Ignavibacteriae bacterium]|nr:IS1 family transposase [Ignavibacteria bacterium]MBI3364161.1 IS1 family transposase [Ignavibacteriota bacterium]
MNILPIEKKSLILSLLTEGQSVRATSRIADVSPVTVLKLLLEAGQKARDIHDSFMVNIRANYIQCDEQWQYVFCKQKRIRSEEEEKERGDFYTFVAMDSDSKLAICYRVGKRNARLTASFMMELSVRVATRFQLSTDSFIPYREAVDRVFGNDIAYAQIHKEYRQDPMNEKRYSPGKIIRVTKNPITGNPNPKRISTSHIERLNLTARMNCRRFTRLSNAFSKSLTHHEAAVALHFFHYNFVRTHQTLRVTPAVEAKVTNRLWNWEDLLNWGREAKAA